MTTPIIIVSGKAGSGKDTAAAHIAKNYNGVTIALADPMKRFVKNLMGFSVEALWGPSSERNVVVPTIELSLTDGWKFDEVATNMFWDVFGVDGQGTAARTDLHDWYFQHILQEVAKNRGISARTVLQTLGTEWGRKQSPLMWINRAISTCRNLVEGGYSYTREGGLVPDAGQAFDYAIITDGRFRNEVLGTIFEGGAAFHIVRPGQEELKGGVAGHRSEKELDGIPDHFYTETIMNDSTLEALYTRVDDAMAVNYGDIRE